MNFRDVQLPIEDRKQLDIMLGFRRADTRAIAILSYCHEYALPLPAPYLDECAPPLIAIALRKGKKEKGRNSSPLEDVKTDCNKYFRWSAYILTRLAQASIKLRADFFEMKPRAFAGDDRFLADLGITKDDAFEFVSKSISKTSARGSAEAVKASVKHVWRGREQGYFKFEGLSPEALEVFGLEYSAFDPISKRLRHEAKLGGIK